MVETVYINPDTGKIIKKDGAVYRNRKKNGLPIISNKDAKKTAAKKTNTVGRKRKAEVIDEVNFINDMMDSSDYDIIETADDGDCFFDSVSKALDGKLSIQEMRKTVAENIDYNTFEIWQVMFQSQTLGRKNKEYNFMKGINSLSALKTLIATKKVFWANDVALDIIEKHYNVKFIIFDDVLETLACTMGNKIKSQPVFIMLARTGDSHYQLVSYKHSTLFNQDELNKPLLTKLQQVCRTVFEAPHFNVALFKKQLENRKRPAIKKQKI